MEYDNNARCDSVRDNVNANASDIHNSGANNTVSMDSNTKDNNPNTKENSNEHKLEHIYSLQLAKRKPEQLLFFQPPRFYLLNLWYL